LPYRSLRVAFWLWEACCCCCWRSGAFCAFISKVSNPSLVVPPAMWSKTGAKLREQSCLLCDVFERQTRRIPSPG
jgi:hypothetical protein